MPLTNEQAKAAAVLRGFVEAVREIDEAKSDTPLSPLYKATVVKAEVKFTPLQLSQWPASKK